MNSFDPDQVAQLFASGFFWGFFCVFLLIGLAVIYFLQTCYARIAPEHRQMEPAMVWLLLIPLFNIVWMFFVYLRLAKSFQGAYAAQGRSEGDCGEKIALIYCITACAAMIPCVNLIAGPAALVLLIIVLIRFNGLKSGLANPPAAGSGTGTGAWGAT